MMITTCKKNIRYFFYSHKSQGIDGLGSSLFLFLHVKFPRQIFVCLGLVWLCMLGFFQNWKHADPSPP